MLIGIQWSYMTYSSTRRNDLASVVKDPAIQAVLTLVNHQIPEFNLWLNNHGIEHLLAYKMERPITNRVHPESKRNMTLFVLSHTPVVANVGVLGKVIKTL